MTKILGLICEDKSDFQVFEEIVKKYIPVNGFKIKKFVSKGCGKLENKCSAWVKNLSELECHLIFILRDLDDNIVEEVKERLRLKAKGFTNKPYIVIVPIKELETWLLTDKDALLKVFDLKNNIKIPNNPEELKDPKKEISKIVKKYRKNTNVFYSNTTHNAKIANKTKLSKFRSCNSFADLDEFLKKEITNKKTKSLSKIKKNK